MPQIDVDSGVYLVPMPTRKPKSDPNAKRWDLAKKQTLEALVACARNKHMINYSDLAAQISAMPMDPHDPRLAQLLGELSENENMEHRGMISALVVHKDGEMCPGNGFFELAKDLGRNISDRDAFWISEVNRVFDVWAKR